MWAVILMNNWSLRARRTRGGWCYYNVPSLNILINGWDRYTVVEFDNEDEMNAYYKIICMG